MQRKVLCPVARASMPIRDVRPGEFCPADSFNFALVFVLAFVFLTGYARAQLFIIETLGELKALGLVIVFILRLKQGLAVLIVSTEKRCPYSSPNTHALNPSV